MRESIHLASTHPPFDTRIFHKECRTLVDAGYRVTLIVPHTRDEVVAGVRIRAVPLPSSGRARLTRTVWDVYRAARAEHPDAIFHFHDAELIVVMLLLKLQGRCIVYDVHEDTPRQMLHQHWIPPRLRRPVSVMMQLFEWLGGRLFDGIIAAEPAIAHRFPAARRVTVHNFPLREELRPAAPTPYRERPPQVAYIGGISEARGIRELVAAVDRLPARLAARLVLGGAFYPAALQAEMEAAPGWRHVDFEGWVSRPRVAEILNRSRVGTVTLHPTEKYVESYPTKLFEYMSAGLPVVASDFPVWRRIVEEAGCGLLVDPCDPAAVAEAIRWLLEHPAEAEAMGARGREAVRRRYSWEQERHTLLAFYAALPCHTREAG